MDSKTIDIGLHCL